MERFAERWECCICGHLYSSFWDIKQTTVRDEHICTNCHKVTEHKLIKRYEMSHEALNPELNKVTPSYVEGAKEESPRPALLAGISEEHLGMALSIISDVSTALTDIPAQIELLSRCSLAQAFVYRNESGQTIFSREQFERAWDAISNTDEKAG